ncbi:MAG: hypothetical protein WDZ51_18125 [Pirellulaceae bacterium]
MIFSAAPRAIRFILSFGVLACFPLLTGCGGYPELSPAAYELTVTLDNVCAFRNEDQLEPFVELLNQETDSGSLSSEDENVLRRIVQLAANGDWEEASRQVRALRLAQNQQAPRGEPVPRKHEHEHEH